MKNALLKNAGIINRLHERINEEFKKEPHGKDHHAACKEFHERYDHLAFPGGYENGIERIKRGDTQAIDAALTFLEVRPYFFRSQYIMTKLVRLLNQASLTPEQSSRYSEIRNKRWQPNKSGEGTA